MKIEIEIQRTSNGYTYIGEGGVVFKETLEAVIRHATEVLIRKCYSKMTDIPVEEIDIYTQITLPGSEFQDAAACAYHYLAEEKL